MVAGSDSNTACVLKAMAKITYKNPKKPGGATQILYVKVNDADKHFARAKRAGAKILEQPDDTFYGHRRYGAEDPEGHHWYFFHEIKKHIASKQR